MTRKEIQTEVLKLSEGALETVTDLVLSFVYYQAVVWEKPTTHSVLYKAPQETEKFLKKVNYQTIKRAVRQLVSRGLVKKSADGEIILTEEGKDRFIYLFPGTTAAVQRKKGEIYLIFYDIANSSKTAREKLRQFLKKSNAVMIQESVFLSACDLREELAVFLKETKVSGQILVTKLGKESLLGKETIVGFLEKIYKLNDLNIRYKEFLKRFSSKKIQEISPFTLDFAFSNIYRGDPKLPTEFLPNDWFGDKALSLYKKHKNGILTLLEQG